MEGGIGKNNKRKTFRVPLNPFTKQPSKLEGYRVWSSKTESNRHKISSICFRDICSCANIVCTTYDC